MSAELLGGVPEAEYHAHPALSASGAKRLIQTCPAVFKHERDNGRPNKAAFDFGHAAHGLVLGIGEPLVVIAAENYQTKAARDLREKAYSLGHVPVLKHEYDQVTAMADAIREHPLASALLDPERGTAERSVFWTDEHWGVERRARFDWFTTINGLPVIVDYKTSTTADPKALGRKAADFGYHQQQCWYLDAAEAVGYDPDATVFTFIFQEKTAPYLVSVIELDERAVALGHEQNARALEIFRDCTASGLWPSYDPRDDVTTISLPRYAFNDSQVML